MTARMEKTRLTAVSGRVGRARDSGVIARGGERSMLEGRQDPLLSDILLPRTRLQILPFLWSCSTSLGF